MRYLHKECVLLVKTCHSNVHPHYVSRKIWSGGKIVTAGPILATKSGPAGPKMTPKFVRLIQNWSGHINTLILCENGLFK